MRAGQVHGHAYVHRHGHTHMSRHWCQNTCVDECVHVEVCIDEFVDSARDMRTDMCILTILCCNNLQNYIEHGTGLFLSSPHYPLSKVSTNSQLLVFKFVCLNEDPCLHPLLDSSPLLPALSLIFILHQHWALQASRLLLILCVCWHHSFHIFRCL